VTPWRAFCEFIKIDGVAKSRKMLSPVIPAEAGIQFFQGLLDPGFRRGDGLEGFLRVHQNSNVQKKRGSIFGGLSFWILVI
jgi:hypothetical protein